MGSSLCIFLALLATAAEAATRTPVTLNQVVTFKDVTKAKWTANLKKTFELGYLKANGYSTDTALITGITYTPSASGVVQFSQIALSIPVVAMVISKIC